MCCCLLFSSHGFLTLGLVFFSTGCSSDCSVEPIGQPILGPSFLFQTATALQMFQRGVIQQGSCPRKLRRQIKAVRAAGEHLQFGQQQCLDGDDNNKAGLVGHQDSNSDNHSHTGLILVGRQGIAVDLNQSHRGLKVCRFSSQPNTTTFFPHWLTHI